MANDLDASLISKIGDGAASALHSSGSKIESRDFRKFRQHSFGRCIAFKFIAVVDRRMDNLNVGILRIQLLQKTGEPLCITHNPW